MNYVIGDVHGCLDDMLELLAKIEKEDREARFYFVGDFIDRGDKIWETVNWFMNHITEDGKYQCVRGNHEQMLADFLDEYEEWYDNGRMYHQAAPVYHYETFEVLKRYIEPTGEQGIHRPEDFEKIKAFIESLPYNKAVEIESKWGTAVRFRIVHAAHAPFEKNKERQIKNNLWGRFYKGIRGSEEIIVHGHTPTASAGYIEADPEDTRPGMVGYRINDINVDGGCAFHAQSVRFPVMLCAVRLEDLEEFYPCTLFERYLYSARIHCRGMWEPGEFAREIAEIYKVKYLLKDSAARKKLLEKMGMAEEYCEKIV